MPLRDDAVALLNFSQMRYLTYWAGLIRDSVGFASCGPAGPEPGAYPKFKRCLERAFYTTIDYYRYFVVSDFNP